MRVRFSALHSFASRVDFSGPSFVFSSCDFVDRCFCQEHKDDPRSHTNQHQQKFFPTEREVTFEAKPLGTLCLTNYTL